MPKTTESLSFGPFHLHPQRRLLLEHGQPVRLGSRALDLLIALTERAGDLVSRTELETRLWPSTVVEETSLRVQVSALRKALRDGTGDARYIANVPGRGYSFVAPVEHFSEPQMQAPASPPAVVGNESAMGPKLPARIDRVIGRDAVCDAISKDLRSAPLVSLVGAGGMGKTTVALVVAKRSLQDHADGVCFVDLSPLAAGSPVLATVADSLGLRETADDLWSVVERHLRDRRMLLVLDNCEHVIQSTAELIERLLPAAPGLRFLATSREALEVQAERVHRLQGLQAHTAPGAASLEEAKQLPAIQLFVERAAAMTTAFDLRADNLKSVCDICLQLDGMPLAIELAAARVDALGVEGVAVRLARMFEVLSRGRRTAYPRHRTLLALLEWSHELLGETERTVLRRLSMLRSSFSLELAASLCRDDQIDAAAVIETTLSLVSKSLIAIDRRGASLQYRLLYTTRSYAEGKLADSGEREMLRRRHALTLCEALDGSGDESRSPWAGELSHLIEDLHQALEWTLTGDAQTGFRLVSSAFQFVKWGGTVRNLIEPIEALIEKLASPPTRQPQLELRLHTARAFLMHNSASQHNVARMADRTLALVAEVGDTGDRIELLYGLYLSAFHRGDYTAALAHAQDMRDLATGRYEYVSVVLADRLLVLALHNLGAHAQAEKLAQRVLAYQPAVPVEGRFDTPVPIAVSMGSVLARIRWLQGFADEAQRICDEALLTCSSWVPLAICQFIGFTAFPIALWRGDLAAAQTLHRQIHHGAALSADRHWISLAQTLGHVLEARLQGDTNTGADRPMPDNDAQLDLLPTLVPEWVTSRALERAEAGAAGWCAPEVLRASAEKLMASGQSADLGAAKALLLRARDLAVSQGALAWQLRIAGSMTRLELAQGLVQAS